MLNRSISAALAGIIFPFVLIPATAFASYDRTCLEILAQSEPASMDDYRETWNPLFQQLFDLTTPLAGANYEAVMDWFHGFSMIITFTDGKKSSFRGKEEKSGEKLFRMLKKADVEAVKFLPADLERLGRTLRDACVAIRRANCDVYLNYSGMSEHDHGRPFTNAEERLIKWVTYHMTPVDSMVEMLNEADNRSEVVKIVEQGRTEKLVHAYNLIAEHFSGDEAMNLYEDFVGPFIDAGFERFMGLYNRKTTRH